jgi:hypothetical protein
MKLRASTLHHLALGLSLGLISGATVAEGQEVQAPCDVTLMQEDFDQGTYVIKQAGTYCLGENISFNPNSLSYLKKTNPDRAEDLTAYDAGYPLPSQIGFGDGQYNPAAFGLGFFAAIAVASPDVTIDLKGHTLEQSEEHALLQRFFSLIETADRPFISGQGPHDFGSDMVAASNLTIQNGRLGRSAHHGIHGNGSANVTVSNVVFEGFEVAAVALNGVQGLTLENLSATSRTDVPVNGKFSAAQFIKHYVNYLARTGADVTINGQSPKVIQERLKTAINNVYDDVVFSRYKTIQKRTHFDEWRLFHNPQRVVDGNAYGFLINGLGVAVDKFPLATSTSQPSRDIWMHNVHVKSLKANVTEVVGLAKASDDLGVVNDPVGSVFQFHAVDPLGRPLTISTLEPAEQGRYVGNVVSDAQALVAKAAVKGLFPSYLDVSRNSMNQDLLAWIESDKPLKSYLDKVKGAHPTGYICNGDQMHHVNKGVIGFKLDGAYDVTVENSSVNQIFNLGKEGSKLCGDYTISHPKAHLPGYGGANVRGVSVSGSNHVSIRKFDALNLRSKSGSAIGIDLMNDSKVVSVEDLILIGINAKTSASEGPTAYPLSVGVRVGELVDDVEAIRCCAYDLTGYQSKEMVDLSSRARVLEMCHL